MGRGFLQVYAGPQEDKILAIYSRAILTVLLYVAFIFRPVNHEIQRAGVSFSIKYADELGIDWKDAFNANSAK